MPALAEATVAPIALVAICSYLLGMLSGWNIVAFLRRSWWTQHAGGDLTSDATRCPPGHGIGVDGHPGQCPESYGVQQVRFPYFLWAFNDAIAWADTDYSPWVATAFGDSTPHSARGRAEARRQLSGMALRALGG